jgi:hypothetical protein
MGSELLRLQRVHSTEEQHAELKHHCHTPDVKPAPGIDWRWSGSRTRGTASRRSPPSCGLAKCGVRYWVKRFLTLGFHALADQPHLGQPSQLTPPSWKPSRLN